MRGVGADKDVWTCIVPLLWAPYDRIVGGVVFGAELDVVRKLLLELLRDGPEVGVEEDPRKEFGHPRCGRGLSGEVHLEPLNGGLDRAEDGRVGMVAIKGKLMG